MFTCGPALLWPLAESGDTDPYFSDVVLLCHFDGTHGQTTTVDSSSYGRALTMGSVALSDVKPTFGTTAADFASGAAAARVFAADSEAWNFGNGQFTIEAWVNYSGAPSTLEAYVSQWATSHQSWFLGYYLGSLSFFWSTNGVNNPNIGAVWTPTAGVDYHIAADRDASNVLRVYVNGAVMVSQTGVTDTFYSAIADMMVGNDGTFNRKPNAHIDEVRITKGVARYAGAFTPPSSPFPDS